MHNLSSGSVRPDRGEEKLGPFPQYPIVVLRTADATERKNNYCTFADGIKFQRRTWILKKVKSILS